MSKLGSTFVAFATFMTLGAALTLVSPAPVRAVEASCTRDCARSCQAQCPDRQCVLECQVACSERCTPCNTCLSFDATRLKSAGAPPGSIVLVNAGVTMAVDTFHLASGATTFGTFGLGLPPLPFGSGPVLNSNNINLVFDYAGAAFTPSEVQLEFLDLGGVQNLSINGSAPFVGGLTGAPPVLAGVTVSVFTTPAAGGRSGVLLLRGPIKSFAIGGQEFWIDNVCAKI